MEDGNRKSKWARVALVALLAIMTIALLAPTVAAQDEETDATVYLFWFIFILIALLLVFLLFKAVVIIQPYEQGLKIVLGKYSGRLNPGLNIVPPLITKVVIMDLRTQVFDVPQQEVITKDNSPTRVDAIIYIKVATTSSGTPWTRPPTPGGSRWRWWRSVRSTPWAPSRRPWRSRPPRRGSGVPPSCAPTA
jgi:regulator of protease activity HflC (stomatin/prohibitin superfamily)